MSKIRICAFALLPIGYRCKFYNGGIEYEKVSDFSLKAVNSGPEWDCSAIDGKFSTTDLVYYHEDGSSLTEWKVQQ